MNLSDIKRNKGLRVFGRLFGTQEGVATLFVVLMMVPNILLLITERYPFSVAMVALLLPAAFYLLLMAVWRKPGVLMLVSLPLMVLGAFQIVLLYLFGGSIIAVDMFTNLFTTNASEAGELLANLWPAILFVCVLYVPLLVLGVRSLCIEERLTGLCRRKLFGTAVGVFVTGMLFASYAWVKVPDFGVKYQVFPINVCYNIKLTLDRWERSERYHETSKEFTFHAVKKQQAPGREIYVLVIGEAARADSWSLFGYERETTPRLEKREGVVPFSNLMTQSNATHKSVPVLLSPASAEDFNEIYKQKSLITAFKEAGFKTWFLSNQVPNRSLIDFFSEEADRRIDISPREGELYTDNRPDGEMLPSLREIVTQDDSSNLLVVMHTYGSHYDYRKRYPQEFARYKPDLISAINSSNRATMVNAYDNSVYYTDYVLDEIITLLQRTEACTALLYASDHGEDMMDDSRSRFLHASPTPTYFQLHVAGFAWFSPQYRALYGDKYAAAESHENSPATTASVFHTITDMASLQSPYILPKYSLVNNAYNPGERLYLNDHDKAVNYHRAGLKPLDFEMFRLKGLDSDASLKSPQHSLR